MKRRKKLTPSVHLWPVFSVKMVAELYEEDPELARARLDRLVARGILARWSQSSPAAPDVYYLSPQPAEVP